MSELIILHNLIDAVPRVTPVPLMYKDENPVRLEGMMKQIAEELTSQKFPSDIDKVEDDV